jgi:NAD(P)-dependent dehydrogenase (short-subunit alcohol dehydrogenase family)
MQGIAGAHAVVTGGGRGIGAAIARALVEAGARVSLMGRSVDVLEAHAASLRVHPGSRVETVHVDVSDEASVETAFDRAVASLGEVAILVNNAGQAESVPFQETTLELWNRTLAVNMTGAFLCSRRVVPGMVAAGRGRIVNIGSTAALRGVARVAAYSASKHGLIGLTRSLALELAKKGVTVNAVCPAYTASDMAERAVAAIVSGTGRTREDAEAMIARSSPLGRLLTPAEVADAVLWLFSDAAAAITGQAVVIGGE